MKVFREFRTETEKIEFELKNFTSNTTLDT